VVTHPVRYYRKQIASCGNLPGQVLSQAVVTYPVPPQTGVIGHQNNWRL